jgi:hypothetical protein
MSVVRVRPGHLSSPGEQRAERTGAASDQDGAVLITIRAVRRTPGSAAARRHGRRASRSEVRPRPAPTGAPVLEIGEQSPDLLSGLARRRSRTRLAAPASVASSWQLGAASGCDSTPATRQAEISTIKCAAMWSGRPVGFEKSAWACELR